jgi:hypothetical protein
VGAPPPPSSSSCEPQPEPSGLVLTLTAPADAAAVSGTAPPPIIGQGAPPSAPARARALYDFGAEQEGDLSFSEADVLVVVDSSQSWWRGYREADEHRQEGVFPSNYVVLLPYGDAEIPWARIVEWEHRTALPAPPGPPPAGVEPPLAPPISRGGSGLLRLDAVERLELWFRLDVGSTVAAGADDMAAAAVEMWRSLAHFQELQSVVAASFSAASSRARDDMAMAPPAGGLGRLPSTVLAAPGTISGVMAAASDGGNGGGGGGATTAASGVPLTRRSCDAKMRALSLWLEGVGAEMTLRECAAVRPIYQSA